MCTGKLNILTILICLLLLGCAEKQTPALRLGTNIWPGYEPLFLAKELGKLSPDKVRLVEYSSASQATQSFRNGLIDAAGLTLDECLRLVESGENLTIVLILDISEGADAILARPDIKTFSGIKGKRVGLENNSTGSYLLERALEMNGLKLADITTVYATADEHFAKFNNKQIDVVVTFEPVRSKLLAEGAINIFDSRQIPGEIVDVLVVRNDYLQQYPQNVQYLIDGWYAAIHAFVNEPLNAAEIMGRRMHLSPMDVLATYNGLILADASRNAQLLTPDLLSPNTGPALLQTAIMVSKQMFSHGMSKSEIDPSPLFSKK